MTYNVIHHERFTGKEEICMTYEYNPINWCKCSCGYTVTMPTGKTSCNCPKCGKRYLMEGDEVFPASLLDACYHDIDE